MAFTVISGGANGVDLEAEKLARHFGLKVKVLIPPCHPRKASLQPLTHRKLAEVIPTTRQVAARLNKNLENPISLKYIHRNYRVVKQADMVLAFTCFQPVSSLCFGGAGWAVEMAKILKKVLYVYDVQRNTWFWYNPEQDLFLHVRSNVRRTIRFTHSSAANSHCGYQKFVRLPRHCLGITRDF